MELDFSTVDYTPVDLSSLNEEQRKAVLTTEGSVLVLAGPGSGKTRVTTTRIAHLVALGHEPMGIVAITFTNKAAAEMRQRVRALLPNIQVRNMWILTFHSMCLRILKDSTHLLDVEKFTIFDEDAVKALFRELLRDLDLHTHHLAKSFRRKISEIKNNLLDVGQYYGEADTEDERTLAQVYEEYQSRLRAQQGFDFDDLIFETVRLLEHNPALLAKYRSQFHHMHVDEYQDTNSAQYKLIGLLAGPNIMVVGDDDQSIYRFRGSNPKHIRAFLKDRPGSTLIQLGQNYRSTNQIVAVSSALVAKNRSRAQKRLRTENASGEPVRVHGARDEQGEAEFVVAEILRLLKEGREPKDFAVLYRTGAQSRIIETYLVRRGIPYMVVKGSSFFDRAEVKDTLAVLRVAAGSLNNVALGRVLTSPTMPRRGIGKGSIKKMSAKVLETGLSLEDAFRDAHAERSFSSATHKAIGRLTALIDEVRQIVDSEPDLTKLVSKVVEKFGLVQNLMGNEEGEERIPNILEIANLATEFNTREASDPEEGATIDGFLDWLALVQGEFTGGSSGRITSDPKNAVSLMTAHASKGLEFPAVFLVGVEEEFMPHWRATSDDPDAQTAIEEERRLAYVAMTRAEELLYLTFALRRTVNGRTLSRRPSRFLGALPVAHLKLSGRAPRAPKPIARPWERWD